MRSFDFFAFLRESDEKGGMTNNYYNKKEILIKRELLVNTRARRDVQKKTRSKNKQLD